MEFNSTSSDNRTSVTINGEKGTITVNGTIFSFNGNMHQNENFLDKADEALEFVIRSLDKIKHENNTDVLTIDRGEGITPTYLLLLLEARLKLKYPSGCVDSKSSLINFMGNELLRSSHGAMNANRCSVTGEILGRRAVDKYGNRKRSSGYTVVATSAVDKRSVADLKCAWAMLRSICVCYSTTTCAYLCFLCFYYTVCLKSEKQVLIDKHPIGKVEIIEDPVSKDEYLQNIWYSGQLSAIEKESLRLTLRQSFPLGNDIEQHYHYLKILNRITRSLTSSINPTKRIFHLHGKVGLSFASVAAARYAMANITWRALIGKTNSMDSYTPAHDTTIDTYLLAQAVRSILRLDSGVSINGNIIFSTVLSYLDIDDLHLLNPTLDDDDNDIPDDDLLDEDDDASYDSYDLYDDEESDKALHSKIGPKKKAAVKKAIKAAVKKAVKAAVNKAKKAGKSSITARVFREAASAVNGDISKKDAAKQSKEATKQSKEAAKLSKEAAKLEERRAKTEAMNININLLLEELKVLKARKESPDFTSLLPEEKLTVTQRLLCLRQHTKNRYLANGTIAKNDQFDYIIVSYHNIPGYQIKFNSGDKIELL